MKSILNRRDVLVGITGMGLGSFIPASSSGQQNVHNQEAPPFTPKDAGPIHEDMLHLISEKLERAAINTAEGLSNLVKALTNAGVITKVDQEHLEKLIKVIFNSANADAMAKGIDEIYETAAGKAGDVAVAVISIARNSIKFAKEQIKEHPRVVDVVSSDVGGALSGATVGKKFGKYGPLIFAVAGAIAASAKAAYSSNPS